MITKYEEGWRDAVDVIVSDFKRLRESYMNPADKKEQEKLDYINSAIRITSKYKDFQSYN